MNTEQNGVYTTALIAKAEFEMRIFERVSKDSGQQLIDEVKRLQELLSKAVAEEREACAKVCENRPVRLLFNCIHSADQLACAAAIRARSNT